MIELFSVGIYVKLKKIIEKNKLLKFFEEIKSEKKIKYFRKCY